MDTANRNTPELQSLEHANKLVPHLKMSKIKNRGRNVITPDLDDIGINSIDIKKRQLFTPHGTFGHFVSTDNKRGLTKQTFR